MTTIEWTDETWNPVTGCDRVSPGCDNCYAERLANGRLKHLYPNGFGEVVCHEDRLDKPLHWRKPRRVFVNSMSDLFHPDVPDAFISRVWSKMAVTPRHTYQILTKRPQRMADFMQKAVARWGEGPMCVLPNVWLGTSIENARYTFRARALAETRAVVTFLSCEPLIGPLADTRLGLLRVVEETDWVIIGGESGPGARPMDLGWARAIRDACQFLEIPLFVKQLGSCFGRDHHNMETWPEDLRIREWPDSASGESEVR